VQCCRTKINKHTISVSNIHCHYLSTDEISDNYIPVAVLAYGILGKALGEDVGLEAWERKSSSGVQGQSPSRGLEDEVPQKLKKMLNYCSNLTSTFL